MSGRVRATMQLRCARCLKDFEAPLDVEVSELYVTAPDADGDESTRSTPRARWSASQMVRDTVGVEMPFSPLCRPDCLGLCPVCGGDRNLGECPGDRSADRSRWCRPDGPVARPARELTRRAIRRNHGRTEEATEQDPRRQPGRELEGEGRRRTRSARSASQPKLPHRVCGNCGYYAGRQAIEVE